MSRRASRDPNAPLIEDLDLPGAGLILSRANLEAWLTEGLGRPVAVRLRRLRYKPGTSVVLGFDLTTASRRDGVAVTEPCVAWAYADHAEAKIAKTLERVPAEACLVHDPGARALVTTAAGDAPPGPGPDHAPRVRTQALAVGVAGAIVPVAEKGRDHYTGAAGPIGERLLGHERRELHEADAVAG